MADDTPEDLRLRITRKAKEHFRHQLMSHPDVEGVGVGRRRRGGRKTDEYAVVIHLRHKLPPAQVPKGRLLPTQLRYVDPDGTEVVAGVDVQERAKPEPEAARVRPVPGGVSIGITGPQLGSGTLGGWVWDTVTRQIVGLSNAHVFGSSPGVMVIQPAHENGGLAPADRIGTVLRAGTLDAAIAEPDRPSLIDASILGAGSGVFEIAEATVDMRVQKTGRASGVTFGVVDLIDFDSDYHGSHTDLWVDAEEGDFSSGGDSGALYLEANDAEPNARRRAVGLHWGGSGTSGVGHPLPAVFNDLGLDTLPE